VSNNNPPDDSSNNQSVDFRRLQFPSDKLTIRDIRDHEPDRIDTKLPRLSTEDSRSLDKLLYMERFIAWAAFAVSIGRGEDYQYVASFGGYKEFEQELVDVYMFYGLSRTTHEATELIRGIKDQARAQARESQGLDPNDGRTDRG
jgi:hypothetical protein